MQGKCLKLTIPEKLFDDSLFIVKEAGYSNLQELTVVALREKVLDIRRKHALEVLEKLKGSVKPRPRLSQEERNRIATEMTPEKSKAITKKYGLEDVTI